MTHAHRLLPAALVLFVGCSDFTPVQGRLLYGPDGSSDNETYNSCTPELFVDRSAADAVRVIGFGGEAGSGGFSFAPKCMSIAVGQSVTWTGMFAMHPLNPGIPGHVGEGSPLSPIANTMSGTTASFTFTRAGSYPFFCGMHGFLGMNGVVVVR